MASMFGQEDHRYDFDEASGNILDQVGDKDLTAAGDITYNPTAGFVQMGGVTSSIFWPTQALNSGQRRFAAFDVWEYREFAIQESGTGVFLSIHQSTSSPGNPVMTFNDTTEDPEAMNAWVDRDQADSKATFVLETGGRVPILGERFFYAYSWTFATGAWTQTLRSDRGVDLSATGTTTGIGQDRAWYIGSDTSQTGNTKMDVYRYGIGNGQIFSLAELQADANLIINQRKVPSGGSLHKDQGLHLN